MNKILKGILWILSCILIIFGAMTIVRGIPMFQGDIAFTIGYLIPTFIEIGLGIFIIIKIRKK